MAYHDLVSTGGLRLHSHDFYELTFVLSGKLKMRIEDEYITYFSGECCLCNKNIHHVEVMDRNTEIVLFLLKEEYLRDLISANYYYDQDGNPHAVGSVFQRFFRRTEKILSMMPRYIRTSDFWMQSGRISFLISLTVW